MPSMDSPYDDVLNEYLAGTIPKDILDDLSSRFIINVPEEERKDVVRICFQIELAHWFYLDFYCPENAFLKPCGMREFAKIIFNHVPSLKEHSDRVDEIITQWRDYKMAVPTFGAIMLNESMEKVLLVQSYFAKASWGFPKGKVNEDEEPRSCAIREVLEETGFDISKLFNEHDFIEHHIRDQLIRLYIVVGIPENFNFAPKTRCEIKGFKWFPVWGLPVIKKDSNCKSATGYSANAFFMVIPFVRGIRKWIASRQPKANPANSGSSLRRQRSKTISDIPSFGQSAAPTNDKKRQTPTLQTGQSSFSPKLSTYSPPPRMMKLKTQKSSKLKSGHAKEKTPMKNHGGTADTSSKTKSDENLFSFSSPTWLNFHFNKNEIMKVFHSG